MSPKTKTSLRLCHKDLQSADQVTSNKILRGGEGGEGRGGEGRGEGGEGREAGGCSQVME